MLEIEPGNLSLAPLWKKIDVRALLAPINRYIWYDGEKLAIVQFIEIETSIAHITHNAEAESTNDKDRKSSLSNFTLTPSAI